MKNDSQKKALLAIRKMKYYVRRYGVLKAGTKLLLPFGTTVALSISNMQAQTPQIKDNDDIKKDLSEYVSGFTTESNLLAYNRKVLFNLDSEVNNRAEWFVGCFVEAAKKHLDAINRSTNKSAYVKKNFFDVVSPSRNLSGSTPYCITALNRALIDANAIAGDLTGVLPNPNSKECYSSNECRAFIKFLRSKGYGDCIDEGYIDLKKLKPGDLVFTVRNSSGSLHASMFWGKEHGKYYCLNFNKEGIRELTKTRGTVVRMTDLSAKSIIKNLERNHLIDTDLEQSDTIIPLETAQKIKQFLYRGRPEEPNKNNMIAFVDDYTKRPPLVALKDGHSGRI